MWRRCGRTWRGRPGRDEGEDEGGKRGYRADVQIGARQYRLAEVSASASTSRITRSSSSCTARTQRLARQREENVRRRAKQSQAPSSSRSGPELDPPRHAMLLVPFSSLLFAPASKTPPKPKRIRARAHLSRRTSARHNTRLKSHEVMKR